MASTTVGIQMKEEMEALGNELKGQKFELQNWGDLSDWLSLSISCLPTCLCSLIVSMGAKVIKM